MREGERGRVKGERGRVVVVVLVVGVLSSLGAAAASASPEWVTVRNLEKQLQCPEERASVSGNCAPREPDCDRLSQRIHEDVKVPRTATTLCGSAGGRKQNKTKEAMDYMKHHNTYLSIVILISKYTNSLFPSISVLLCKTAPKLPPSSVGHYFVCLPKWLYKSICPQ